MLFVVICWLGVVEQHSSYVNIEDTDERVSNLRVAMHMTKT